MTSLHPTDIEAQYCPECRSWHDVRSFSPARSFQPGAWCNFCLETRDHMRRGEKLKSFWRRYRRAFRAQLRQFRFALVEG